MKIFTRLLMAATLLLGLGSTVKAADLPRSEYPRPQFERERWMNLNGTWTYTFDFGQTGAERDFRNSKGFDGKITVPFCPESSLSGVKHTDFIPCIWYQRTITVPETWGGKNILLNFGAVDYDATIFIDGKKVGRHCGAGSSFSLDITKFVKAGGSVNLVIQVKDNLRGGKQPECIHACKEGSAFSVAVLCHRHNRSVERRGTLFNPDARHFVRRKRVNRRHHHAHERNIQQWVAYDPEKRENDVGFVGFQKTSVCRDP